MKANYKRRGINRGYPYGKYHTENKGLTTNIYLLKKRNKELAEFNELNESGSGKWIDKSLKDKGLINALKDLNKYNAK